MFFAGLTGRICGTYSWGVTSFEFGVMSNIGVGYFFNATLSFRGVQDTKSSLSHQICDLLKSLISYESYYFSWRGDRYTGGYVIDSDLILIVTFIYRLWDVSFFLCQMMFAIIYWFRLIVFMFFFSV